MSPTMELTKAITLTVEDAPTFDAVRRDVDRRLTDLDELLDDVFHGCAFAAYVELAAECGGVPDEETTRRRAFRYYEDALAAKQGRLPRR